MRKEGFLLSFLRVSHIKKTTRVEGPGLRYTIWVQGCPIKCKGCFNPHTWDERGGTLMDINDIFDDITETLMHKPELEGVTFLGGEPFSQAQVLSLLGTKIKKLNLSVVTFSGYPYEKLRNSKNSHWQALLNVTDLLIDGPYVESLHDLSRPWVGSTNQQYRFLTDVYHHKKEELLAIDNKLEICIHPNGTISLNGMASSLDLTELTWLEDCEDEDQ